MRACEANWATAFGPDRVGKYADAAYLQEECRMADEGGRYSILRCAGRRREDRVLYVVRPGLQPGPPPPGNRAAAPADGDMRVEEPAAVEVI